MNVYIFVAEEGVHFIKNKNKIIFVCKIKTFEAKNIKQRLFQTLICVSTS